MAEVRSLQLINTSPKGHGFSDDKGSIFVKYTMHSSCGSYDIYYRDVILAFRTLYIIEQKTCDYNLVLIVSLCQVNLQHIEATAGNHARSHDWLIQISAFSIKDNSDCAEWKVCFSIPPDGFVVSWSNKYWVESLVNNMKVILPKTLFLYNNH